MAWALAPKGGLEEAHVTWEKSLERDPPDHQSWHGYAELCLFLGHEARYRRALKALFERWENATDNWVVAEHTRPLFACSCLFPGMSYDAQ